MQTLDQARPLSERTGEELLIMAVGGNPQDRKRIHRELTYRALLAEGARRAGRAFTQPRLRLVGFGDRAA